MREFNIEDAKKGSLIEVEICMNPPYDSRYIPAAYIGQDSHGNVVLETEYEVRPYPPQMVRMAPQVEHFVVKSIADNTLRIIEGRLIPSGYKLAATISYLFPEND